MTAAAFAGFAAFFAAAGLRVAALEPANPLLPLCVVLVMVALTNAAARLHADR